MPKKRRERAFGTIFLIIVATFLSKIVGLARTMIFAGIFGAGFEFDVFTAASNVTLVIFDLLLGSAVAGAFIPIFNKFLARGDNDGAEKFAGAFLTALTLATCLLTAVLVFFAPFVMRVFVGSFPPEKLAAAERIFMVMTPILIWMAIAYALSGVLQSLGQFLVPAIMTLIPNLLFSIYLLFFGKKLGIFAAGVAALVAFSFQFLAQIPFTIRAGFKYRPSLKLRGTGVTEALLLGFPVLVSSWNSPAISLIDMRFASGLADGAFSAVSVVGTIFLVLVTIFSYSFSSFFFPKFSKLAESGDFKGFARETASSISALSYIILFVTAAAMVFPTQIISLLYGRGEFGKSAVDMTGIVLFYTAMSLFGASVSEILNKSFFAIKNGKIPMLAAIASIILKISLALLFVKVWNFGLPGLIASSVIGTTFATVLLFALLARKIPSLLSRGFAINMAKIFACFGAALFMGLFLRRFFTGAENSAALFAKLAIFSIIMFLGYISVGALLRIDEIRAIFAARKGAGCEKVEN